MTSIEEQMMAVAEAICSGMLGLPLSASQAPPIDLPSDDVLTGSVAIDGAWNGVIVLQCSSAFARRAASVMFELGVESVGREELTDALGELANMVAGNIKALLPAPSRLALPIVDDERNVALAAAITESQVWLESEDGTVVVSLVTGLEPQA